MRRYAKAEANNEPATREDLRQMGKDLQRGVSTSIQRQSQPSTAQSALRVVRMMGRGISNINKSLSHSYDPRRPRISQLPRRREDMGIVSNLGEALEGLKDPHLAGRDITGRRIRK